MPSIPKLFRIISISRIFRKLKTRRLAMPMEPLSETPVEGNSEKYIPEAPGGTPIPQESILEAPVEKPVLRKALPRATIGRPVLRRHISEPTPRRYYSICGIATPHPKEPLLGALIERPTLKASIGRRIPEETFSEVPVQMHVLKELLPEASNESITKTTRLVKRRRPRATAQNNRLLALPTELRMQIYDELLAIPRTVYILEPDKYVKSHLHKVRRFDKELFSSRGRLRYKFSAPCVGYYDPRTTTFAVRFQDDDGCTHRMWLSETTRAGEGIPTSAAQVTSPVDLSNRPAKGIYLVFSACSATTLTLNRLIWNQIHEQLCDRPEIQILELEFPKLCSLVKVMKSIVLGRFPGWRELRKLRVLRIRLRHGNGGPLNAWEMIVLRSLAATVHEEMRRKVILKRGPRVEIAW
jgi:hypothetical protein